MKQYRATGADSGLELGVEGLVARIAAHSDGLLGHPDRLLRVQRLLGRGQWRGTAGSEQE